MDEQVEIARLADELSETDGGDLLVERSNACASRLRQSILKRAFEGKLVPQDTSDEPASALIARIQSERQATDLSACKAPANTKAKAAKKRSPE